MACRFFEKTILDLCVGFIKYVVAQQGYFYGGWISANLIGPFKGPKGT